MNLPVFKCKDKLTNFMVDSFISNYIPDNPLLYFNKMINNCYEKIPLNQDNDFNIGSYKPGVSYQFVNQRLQSIYKVKKNIDSNTSIEIIMGIDNLADVYRIAVYYFLNKSLFAVAYNFPFISQDEIKDVNSMITEKYGIKNAGKQVKPLLIKGRNNVVIQVHNFVSLSYKFIHVTSSITAIITKSFAKMKNLEALEFHNIRRAFLAQV